MVVRSSGKAQKLSRSESPIKIQKRPWEPFLTNGDWRKMPRKRDLITRIAEAEDKLDKLKLEENILALKARTKTRRKPRPRTPGR